MSETYLSNKRALLSNLGTSVHDLYYSTQNSSISAVECSFAWQNTISFPSIQFNSSSTISIPIDQFVQCAVCHFTLPALQAGEYLPRGWGPACIESIAYTIGASSSTQIVLQGDSIMQTLMGQCNSKEKRNAMLSLSGEVAGSALAQPAGTVNEATFVIPLPFSTMCQDKLPIDSTLLSNNITVTIIVKPASSIYGGSVIHPTQFTLAEVILKQGKLSNQSSSLRSMMVAEPEAIYSYPFTHAQRFVSPTFAGSTAYQGCSVLLNQFPNADFLGMVIWVVEDEYKQPAALSSTPNPWLIDPIKDILLTFNGSTLFNFKGHSHKLCGMLAGDQHDPSYDMVQISGSPPPALLVNATCWPVFLDFSRERAICMGDHMFNVFRCPNNNMLLQFSTSKGSSTAYKLYATYYFNAALEMSSGVSSVYIG